MDFEEQLLSRVTVNYLFLGQCETFRASVKTLWRKNPAIAAAILNAVITEVGGIKGISWSKGITSPAHLAWLTFSQILELQMSPLLQEKGRLSWSIDFRLLKLQLEALFLLHNIIQLIEAKAWLLESGSSDIVHQSSSPRSSSDDPDIASLLEDTKRASQDYDDSSTQQLIRKGVQPLKRIFATWNSRIKFHFASAHRPADAEKVEGTFDSETLSLAVEEESLPQRQSLQQVVLCEPELVSALCWCIIKIKQLLQHISEKDEGSDGNIGEPSGSLSHSFNSVLLQKVQESFLNILQGNLSFRESLRFLPLLQMDFGVPNEIYRDVLFELARKAVSQDTEALIQSNSNRAVFELCEAIQASGSAHLVHAIESAQDSFLTEDRESSKVSTETTLPPPLQYLHQGFRHLRGENNVTLKSDDVNADDLVCSCLRQLFHYSRATGTHMFDTVMGAALSSIKMNQFQKAIDILAVFPRLQPLAAVIGWDLLAGNTSSRRSMLEALWLSKAVDSSSSVKHEGQFCCVDHLCDQLCYRLDIAYFAAHINSGLDWTMGSLLYPYRSRAESSNKSVETKPTDDFVANLVLERLAMHSPIRVLFDVVPNVKLKHAKALLKMCPTTSELAASMRSQDLELLELHFGVQTIVLTLGAMEKGMQEGDSKELRLVALSMLEDLRAHILSILNMPRRIFLMGIIVDLLLMDNTSMPSTPNGLESKLSSLIKQKSETVENEDALKITTVQFIGRLLEVLREGLFTPSTESEEGKLEYALPKGFTSLSGQKAWDWKTSNILRFIEDWNWRLAVLQRLAPSSQRQWQWKEALAVLRAAPSTLLNMCVQRAQYDLGEEAVHRFSLPPEDAAVLQLAEWVDGAVARASVDDAVSRVVEGATSPEEALELATLRAPLAPLTNVLLCIDVAAASARAVDVSRQLLLKARSLLADLSSGTLYRQGSMQAEQIQESCMLSVGKRVVQCLQDLVEKVCTEKNQTLQAFLSGMDMVNVISESAKHGHRYRALNILQQTVEDGHNGKRQFLSGKLHNLVKALADEEPDESPLKAVSFSDKKVNAASDNGFLLGCGVRALSKQSSGPTPSATSGDHSGETSFFPLKGTGKRYLGPLVSKPFAYLSAFILYIATVGDIVDGVDTTHDFNFFTLVYERSNDLLTRLVFERGSANAAGKVAEIMGADLAQEVISACVSPIYPPKSPRGWACVALLPYRDTNQKSLSDKGFSGHVEQETGLYPLNLDVIKHLTNLSPVRAILACVFGTSRFRISNCPDENIRGSDENGSVSTDTDRPFYEYALDQSDRFPTLNRWIRTQANLQQLSAIPILTRKRVSDGQPDFIGSRLLLKRPREHDSDTESEEDEDKCANTSSNRPVQKGLDKAWKNRGIPDSSGQTRNSSKMDSMEAKNSKALVFEWENESIYEDTVSRLLEQGKMVDALRLADRCLRGGAPDYLLRLLIENTDGGHAGAWQGNQNIWKMTWQYCIRLKDKKLAASLAVKHFRSWDLEAAIDVLTMCSCHLSEKDLLYDEVLQLNQSLQLYSRIIKADGKLTDWRQVESLCQKDPEDLSLRLSAKGAVSAALEVAEHYGLRKDLRQELQGRHLVKLLTSDPVNGAGPAEALRFLCSVKNPEDALPVAMAAVEQLPSLHAKQLLVNFFLKKHVGILTNEQILWLDKLALGLQTLGALPLLWQQKCGALHQHPELILETLLMNKQLQVASELLSAFPALRDDDLICKYAAKAISPGSYPDYERRLPSSTSALKSKRSTVAGGRSTVARGVTLESNAPSTQKESRRPFFRSKDKDGTKKRKFGANSPSVKAAGDATTGVQEELSHAAAQENLERTRVTMTEGWLLTGDSMKDGAVRDSHRYESAPCIALFKSLLGLCSSEEVAVKASVRICVKHMKQILNSMQLPPNASSEVVERAFYATEAFVQALLHAKGLLRKLLGNTETAGTMEGLKDVNHNPNGGTQIIEIVNSDIELPDGLLELLFQVVEWLSRAELLQSLLGSGFTASLDDVLTKDAAENLRDRLIKGERYNMAVYCCTKCKVNAFPVWKAWAHALVQMEHYTQARVKLKQALKLHNEDPAPIAREIVATMEASPPVDIPSVRSLYDHMAKNANSIMDDSLSTDAYLNVLYIPSSFTKHERSRRASEGAVDNFAASAAQSGAEEGPGSNLDRSRYDECIFYLQEYARQDLLAFMFRHCHYADACLLFFPPKAVPSPPSTTIPQRSDSLRSDSLRSDSLRSDSSRSDTSRSDSLATDFGTIEDLCKLCIAYGAMPVLERIIATRELASAAQDPSISAHTAAALARVCSYCETHKNFNHLYRFQVLRKDHVAAGLCCIQLFLNSSNQEQALRQLERAKTHFDEGFYARQQGQGTEVSKPPTKTSRGKSPSDKFSEEELMKFSTRLSIQMEAVRCFSEPEGPPWKHSLFGNPTDADTLKRRLQVAEALAERNFDLAFRIIYDFGLPPVQIYAAVASSLADRKKGNQLTELLRNIKATISDEDLDQVIGAAIMVFANNHKERPDRLIDMLSSSHRRVLSYVACGRLKTAFQIASQSDVVADVLYVSDQAKRIGMMSVVDLCKQWLSRHK